MSDSFQKLIKKYPDEWFWFHKRFKTRPVEEPEASVVKRPMLEHTQEATARELGQRSQAEHSNTELRQPFSQTIGAPE